MTGKNSKIIVNKQEENSEKAVSYTHLVIENMMKSIYHRGPDGGGNYIDEDVALGFRRLIIIYLDLSLIHISDKTFSFFFHIIIDVLCMCFQFLDLLVCNCLLYTSLLQKMLTIRKTPTIKPLQKTMPVRAAMTKTAITTLTTKTKWNKPCLLYTSRCV